MASATGQPVRAVWQESHALNLHTYWTSQDDEEIQRFRDSFTEIYRGYLMNFAMVEPRELEAQRVQLLQAIRRSPLHPNSDPVKREARSREAELASSQALHERTIKLTARAEAAARAAGIDPATGQPITAEG